MKQQCSRSVMFWNGSGFFLQWPSKRQKKVSFYCLLLTVGTFTSVFKDNKSCGSHKTEQIIKVFSNYFACWWKVPDPGGPDLHPDPEHCKKRINHTSTLLATTDLHKVREMVERILVDERHQADHQRHASVPTLNIRVSTLLYTQANQSVQYSGSPPSCTHKPINQFNTRVSPLLYTQANQSVQ